MIIYNANSKEKREFVAATELIDRVLVQPSDFNKSAGQLLIVGKTQRYDFNSVVDVERKLSVCDVVDAFDVYHILHHYDPISHIEVRGSDIIIVRFCKDHFETTFARQLTSEGSERFDDYECEYMYTDQPTNADEEDALLKDLFENYTEDNLEEAFKALRS